MKNIPPHNTFDNVKGKASNHVKELSESKTKKLREALEHGLADLSTKDELVRTIRKTDEQDIWMNFARCSDFIIVIILSRGILMNGINHSVANREYM